MCLCVCVSHTRTCVLLLSSPSLSPRRHHYRSNNVKALISDLASLADEHSPLPRSHSFILFLFFLSFSPSLILFLFLLFLSYSLSLFSLSSRSLCVSERPYVVLDQKVELRGLNISVEEPTTTTMEKKLTREAGSKIILS